ncbi:hypothetical protein [Rhodoligotrophos defluvii]|uniref:hypothetical protein n=1 Tax=Rhodoligotrophos defluvii TaxID=2561934 RepID=UPI0010C98A8A|nr:hypothetical protein [Rhodoligotrophos defluvii]
MASGADEVIGRVPYTLHDTVSSMGHISYYRNITYCVGNAMHRAFDNMSDGTDDGFGCIC